MSSSGRLKDDLIFSGEQVVPGRTPEVIWREHIQRYAFASAQAQGVRVLDVACGTGYGSAHLADRGARYVVGGDLSGESLAFAGSSFRRKNLSFVRVTVDRMPFRDGSFDLVVSFETIEHLDRRAAFLRECRRVLAKDGIFLSSTPMRLAYRPPWAPKPENPFHTVEFSLEDYRRLLLEFFHRVELYGQCPASLSKVLRQYAAHSLGRVLSAVPAAKARLQPFRAAALGEIPPGAASKAGTGAWLDIRPLRRRFPGFPSYVVARAMMSDSGPSVTEKT